MSMFTGKTLLITGGTGSFGNAVLKRFLDTDIKEIRIFSRDEKKQDDMRKKYNNDKLKFYIGDVRNVESLENCMLGVDYIFHAAALKQVPSCEFFPMEAVRTNIEGTNNVLTVAAKYGVKRIVCISTDKAVYPINAMGISKAMMEKVIRAKAKEVKDIGTTICCTRCGNLIYSRSSVIPLFIEQIRAGKAITITDPNMTRFLMSLDEAVDLVLFAFKNGEAGDLFIPKANASTLENLAKAVQKIYGDTGIEIVGSRCGEKLHETLLTKEESLYSKDFGNYFKVSANEKCSEMTEDFLSCNANLLSVDEIVRRIKKSS